MSHDILSPNDRLESRINYELCTAVDMTKLSIVLSKMKKEGIITPKEHENLMGMGSNLLHLMIEAKTKHFIKKKST